MLKRDRERSCWDSTDYQFMTEESEGEDNKVVRHLLPWRSECKPCSLYTQYLYTLYFLQL